MAAPTITVRIQGYSLIEKKLLALPTKIARKVASQAMRAGTTVIRDEAKRQSPKDTGALQKSIRVRVAKKKRRGEVKFTVTTSSKDHVFKGDQFYGGFQEYGYRLGKASRDVKKLQNVRRTGSQLYRNAAAVLLDGMTVDQRKKVPGKRFMQRAFNTRGRMAADVIGRKLVEGIAREAKTP